MKTRRDRLLVVANDVDLLSYHMFLAEAAREAGLEVHLAAPGEAPREADAGGYPFHSLSLSRQSMNPFREARTLQGLARLYRRLRPAIVHHYTIKPVLYGGIAARWTGVPSVVHTVTGLGHVFIDGALRTRVLRHGVSSGYRASFRHRNTRVIFHNPQDLEFFSDRRLLEPTKARYLGGPGVDTERFRTMPEPEGPPLVVLPSRMLWQKGVVEFVSAARRLKERGVEARFALVGDTDEKSRAAIPPERLREWQTEGVIEWWGWRSDMVDVYRQSHIVCLPSYREGLPRVIIEAAACGRPTVTTDVPGCRESIRDGETGILVPVRDAEALATALGGLISDGALRRRMGEAGRGFTVESFDRRRVCAETIGIYRELLTCHDGQGAPDEAAGANRVIAHEGRPS